MLGEFNEKFEGFTNEELVNQYHNTKNDLIIKHLMYVNKDLIVSAYTKYFLKGQEKEDLRQEIYIGFTEAVVTYDTNKNAGFKTYAKKVINNKCVSCIIKCNRNKNVLFNDSLSLNIYTNEEERTTVQDTLVGSKKINPDFAIYFEDNYKYCSKVIRNVLTDLEYQVWMGFIWGISYKDLSNQLHRSYKAIDNALQRCKKNIRNVLDKYDITFEMLKHYMRYIRFNVQHFILQTCETA